MIKSIKPSTKLVEDKRIKSEAMRVVRTMIPGIKCYADSRVNGVRHKAYITGMSLSEKHQAVVKLNAIFKKRKLNAVAYIHEGRNGYGNTLNLCIFVSDGYLNH